MSSRRVLLSVADADPTRIEPHVLAKAAQISRALDADLELFHSVFDPGTVRAGRLRRIVQADIVDRVNEARRRLERAADSLRDQNVRAHACVHWDYPAHEAVVRHVFRYEPDLLIAASSRKTRPKAPNILAYSDLRLLQTCPCPALMIKTARPYRRSAVIAALDPPDVPAKSPTLDEAILAAGHMLASALNAPFHACHAVPAVLVAVPGRPAVVAASPERQAANLKAAWRKVHAITDNYVLPDRSVHVVQGIAETSVASLVKETLADIIVMGTASLDASKASGMGRTAERLLHALDCDVLVVKPPGYRSPVSRQSIRLTPTATARPRAHAPANQVI